MKIISLFIFYILSFQIFAYFDFIEKNIKAKNFDSIGTDHLNKIWLFDKKNGKLIFLDFDKELKNLEFYPEVDFIYDFDLDFGEVGAKIGSQKFSIFKEGIFQKEYELNGQILGICWVKNDELAFAILNETNRVEIKTFNILNNNEKSLGLLSDIIYKNYYPNIYLKYYYKKSFLYIFDYYNHRFMVVDLDSEKIIYRLGIEKEKSLENMKLIIKNDVIKEGKISTFNFLISNQRFGIDEKGNFWILEKCIQNKQMVIKKLLLDLEPQEELYKLIWIQCERCYDNVFYYNDSFIFYSSKDKDVFVFKK